MIGLWVRWKIAGEHLISYKFLMVMQIQIILVSSSLTCRRILEVIMTLHHSIVACSLRKEYPQIKHQLLRKTWIWIFGFLVQQINSFWKVLKLKQNFQRNKAATDGTPFFDPCCTHHSICVNIGFWYDSFVW